MMKTMRTSCAAMAGAGHCGTETRIGQQCGASNHGRRGDDDHDIRSQRRAVQRRTDRAADRIQRRKRAVVHVLGSVARGPCARSYRAVHCERDPDRCEREQAEQERRRESVPQTERDIDGHAGGGARGPRERAVEQRRRDAGKQAARREDEWWDPQWPRRVMDLHRWRRAAKRQHAREQSRQSQQDACEHDQSEQPGEPLARMQQRLVGSILAHESECQRHTGHRERGGAPGERRNRHRATQTGERRNVARADLRGRSRPPPGTARPCSRHGRPDTPAPR